MKPIRIASRWDDAREDAAARAIGVRWRRRKIARRAAIASAAAAVLGLSTWIALDRRAGAPVATERAPERRDATAPEAPEAPADRIAFADGSVAELDRAELDVERDSTEHVRVRLRSGAARFEVVRRPSRAFEVTSPHTAVRVIGTAFTVRIDDAGDRTRVDVTRGHVLVTSEGTETHLLAGQGTWFPSADGAGDEHASAAEPAQVVTAPARARESRWVSLAREQRFDDAYDALRASGGGARGADELWLAADSARRSGHPREAVPYLERLLQEHPHHGSAPLAAFTLGRVELDLGRAARAADMFARARAMAPRNALAEDALAREVVARNRAGQRDAAQRLAREYLDRHPNGRRAAEVRAIAGDR
jgi:transmembrane sensor